jgi:hypothetical protein
MRRARSKNARAVLVWFAVAFLLWQLALAGLVETVWPEVRDLEWDQLVQRLRQRRAEAPRRPLVVVLGSSRSQMAFDAAWLSRSPGGPLVFNASVPGAGPLTQRMQLERLLALDLRPDQVVLEVMPPFFSENGACFEEGFGSWERETLAELTDAVARAREPGRLLKRWLKGRAVPSVFHQPGLQRRLLPAKLCSAGDSFPGGDRDGHGRKPGPGDLSAARRAELTATMLGQYDRALRSPAFCQSRWRDLVELVARCRQQGIGCVLVLPPENTAFRSRLADSTRQSLQAALTALAREYRVGLLDARDWLSDEEFMDGHHATQKGTTRFTARFEMVWFHPAVSISSR